MTAATHDPSDMSDEDVAAALRVYASAATALGGMRAALIADRARRPAPPAVPIQRFTRDGLDARAIHYTDTMDAETRAPHCGRSRGNTTSSSSSVTCIDCLRLRPNSVSPPFIDLTSFLGAAKGVATAAESRTPATPGMTLTAADREALGERFMVEQHRLLDRRGTTVETDRNDIAVYMFTLGAESALAAMMSDEAIDLAHEAGWSRSNRMRPSEIAMGIESASKQARASLRLPAASAPSQPSPSVHSSASARWDAGRERPPGLRAPRPPIRPARRPVTARYVVQERLGSEWLYHSACLDGLMRRDEESDDDYHVGVWPKEEAERIRDERAPKVLGPVRIVRLVSRAEAVSRAAAKARQEGMLAGIRWAYERADDAAGRFEHDWSKGAAENRDEVIQQTMHIRLAPMGKKARMLPLARVQLGIGWRNSIASDPEQRAKAVHRPEPPIEAEREGIRLNPRS